MSAFPKADVQNIRVGAELNVCLWPEADVQISRYAGRHTTIYDDYRT